MPPTRRSRRSPVSCVLVVTTLAWLSAASLASADGLPDRSTTPQAASPCAPAAEVVCPAATCVLTEQADDGSQAASVPAHVVPSVVGSTTRRPHALIPVFASYAVVQALDVHSTLRALNAGAVEQNPFMTPLVRHPVAFVGLKAAITAGTIFAADRLSRHHRLAAYCLMFAMNSAYAVVVAHNYRIADNSNR